MNMNTNVSTNIEQARSQGTASDYDVDLNIESLFLGLAINWFKYFENLELELNPTPIRDSLGWEKGFIFEYISLIV